jgi:hypothetical protein
MVENVKGSVCLRLTPWWCTDIMEVTFQTFLTQDLYIYQPVALQPFAGPWPLFSFKIVYTVGRTPWTGDQPVARPLPTHRTTQTSMPWVGFEPTIPAFELAKAIDALDRAVTVIDNAGLDDDKWWHSGSGRVTQGEDSTSTRLIIARCVGHGVCRDPVAKKNIKCTENRTQACSQTDTDGV